MFREFIYTELFRKSWAAMGMTDENLIELEDALLSDPRRGSVIEGTGGARKVRISIGNKGKSGGGRVIYVDVYESEKLYCLLAYPKNVQEDLTADQKAAVRKMVEAIKKEG